MEDKTSKRSVKKERQDSLDKYARHRSRSPGPRKYEEGRMAKKRRRSSDGDLEVPRRPRRRSSDGDLEVERRPRRGTEPRPMWEGRRGREADTDRITRGEGRRDREADRRIHREERRNRRQDDGSNSLREREGNSRNDDRFGGPNEAGPAESTEPAEQNFGLSGKLAAETNTYRGIVLNYSEPEEARIPKTRWRFYCFKGEEVLPTFFMHRQSAYLIGRDRRVCDMPVDHPSCSKQHAVLQYRLVQYEKPDGTTGKKVRPYVIDLGSTNGTYINSNRIEAARYYEMQEQDVLKFGFSSREYVLLHENSKGQDEADEEK